MKTIAYILISFLLLTGCKTAQKATPEQAAATKALVTEGNYEITFSRANPLNTSEMAQLSSANLLPMDSRAGQINLVGTTNYIKKHNDSLEVYLPYYGTRQIGSSMNDNNAAIEFEGIPEAYEVTYDEAKQRSTVKVVFKERSEQYNLWLTVEANRRVHARVNSTQRTAIGYRGELSPSSKD